MNPSVRPEFFSKGSKNRLTHHDLDRFPGNTLFDRLARAVCRSGCLPRKELYEAWETARRTHRRFNGGRMVDLAGGHGLLAHVLLLLDREAPGALVVDPAVPASAARLSAALTEEWPQLEGKVIYQHVRVEDAAIQASDIVVSCHACGALTDRVLDLAIAARAQVSVLPCCHDTATCDAGPLAGWLDPSLAIDAVRALRLQHAGYQVWTQTIPGDITPKNRLLLGMPVVHGRL